MSQTRDSIPTALRTATELTHSCLAQIRHERGECVLEPSDCPALSQWQIAMDGGKVTPLHQHPEADETFYLLEGEILLHIDGQERRVGPGGLAVLPLGVPHAFMVTSPQAKMLCFQNPPAVRRSSRRQ